MAKKIPNYIKYIFVNILFLLVFTSFFRILFYTFFSELNSFFSSEVQKAFWLGTRFDIKLTVITLFPLAIFVLVLNHRFFKQKIYKLIATFYLTLAYLVLTLFYLFDLGYYDYLTIRLDASSLRFLSNLKISSQVLIESYPIYKLSLIHI